MIKILKNLKPYWKSVIVILLLMMVQAYCDLAMPQYTSDIIDVGLINNGIDHIMPERVTEKEYHEAQIFMDEEEQTLWTNCYVRHTGNAFYVRKVTEEETLDRLDDELLTAIVLTYQLGHMEETEFRAMVASAMVQNPQTAALAEQIDQLSLAEIGQALHMEIDSFTAKNEDGETAVYVDTRPLMEALIASGQMDTTMVTQLRETMEKTIDAIGSDTLRSMGIAYAASCDEAAGMDIDAMQMAYLWSAGRKMVLMAAIMLAAAALVSYFAAKAGAGVGRDLRNKVFCNVMAFSHAEMDKFSTASLITRSTNDVQQVQMVCTMLLRMLLYAPVLAVGGIIKVWQTGADMGWVIALGVLVIIGFVGLLVSVTMPKFKIMQKLVDGLNLISREILTGLSVIRAFGREKTEEERFDTANTRLMQTQLFTNRAMTFMMPGMMLIMNCLVILITWTAAHQIDLGKMQVGTMTAFITYAMLIVMSFLILTMMSIMLPRAGVAAERIEEVIRTQPSIVEAEETIPLQTHRGEVEFDHVCFRYPGAKADVLHDLTFKVEPGKMTAIIGSTGAGKTTMVNLLPRFYDVTAGVIRLDGEDIRQIPLKDLREEIGFVPQKGVLFSGTIASNLRFGRPKATMAELRGAAQIAQATEFIEEKEEKYQAYIAQGGSNVSGGQKQRLAIARAIVKQPKIFVFDDSFSALDMKTDAKLRKALADTVTDSTVIIVAQRISTILHADQILVLDDGEIVGKGTHSELLKTCEVYRQIAQSQLSAKELAQGEGGAVHG